MAEARTNKPYDNTRDFFSIEFLTIPFAKHDASAEDLTKSVSQKKNTETPQSSDAVLQAMI